MKIVVVGDGKVGFTIARSLDQEGHDITIIDNKPHVLTNTLNLLDVVGVHGNGASVDVQLEAGVDEADLLIAATSTDEMNITCCLLAKQIGAKRTIARIRNPEYLKSMNYIKEELGLSMHINPELAAAREITTALTFSSALKVNKLAKSRVIMTEIKIFPNSPLINRSLSQIYKTYRIKVLVVTIIRGDQVIIPTGNTIIMPNDKITVTASTRDLEKFFQYIGITNRKLTDIMIVGGGKIAYYLMRNLIDMGCNVKLIEKKKERCLELLEEFEDAVIIQGDGSDHELLMSEGLDQHDAFIALTGNDEENVIMSMFASGQGVRKVIPKVNRMTLGFILEKLGLESTITPKNIVADEIIQYVRAIQNTYGSNVESMIHLVDDRVEVLEFRAKSNCSFLNKPLCQLNLKEGIIVGYITHEGVSELANGNSIVREGDTVLIITRLNGLRELNDVLAN